MQMVERTHGPCDASLRSRRRMRIGRLIYAIVFLFLAVGLVAQEASAGHGSGEVRKRNCGGLYHWKYHVWADTHCNCVAGGATETAGWHSTPNWSCGLPVLAHRDCYCLGYNPAHYVHSDTWFDTNGQLHSTSVSNGEGCYGKSFGQGSEELRSGPGSRSSVADFHSGPIVFDAGARTISLGIASGTALRSTPDSSGALFKISAWVGAGRVARRGRSSAVLISTSASRTS